MDTIKDILNNIDTSKKETFYVDLTEMCDKEFDIYDYIHQPEDNMRLTYCYYHRWICTDTEVGIRVWYFDNKPVCISWKPYRKSSETFGWFSEDDFKKVKEYVHSLISNDYDEPEIEILDNDKMNNVIEKFDSIDYKKFEEKYVK